MSLRKTAESSPAAAIGRARSWRGVCAQRTTRVVTSPKNPARRRLAFRRYPQEVWKRAEGGVTFRSTTTAGQGAWQGRRHRHGEEEHQAGVRVK
jgi:hypothetical protein